MATKRRRKTTNRKVPFVKCSRCPNDGCTVCPLYDQEQMHANLLTALESPERKKFVQDAMTEVLVSFAVKFGWDISSPLEMQADLRHLRKWRGIIERGAIKVGMTTIGVITAAVLAVFWLGFQTQFHK